MRRSRRGVALPLVLLVLVVTGVLSGLLVWSGLLEARSGGNAIREVQALGAAETGAVRAAVGLPRAVAESLAVGATVASSGDLGDAGRYQASIRALGNRVFLVRADGVDPTGRARRTVALLGHLSDSTDTLGPFGALGPLPARNWVNQH